MKAVSAGFILLFFFVPFLSNGQYILMVEEDKCWIYLNYIDSDSPSPFSGHAITLQGDTLINSINYKKVYRHQLKGSNNCPTPPCWQFDIPYQSESKELISFIREDTIHRKIYNLPILSNGFCDTGEHLIFDFSLKIGDTLNSCIYDFIGTNNNPVNPVGIVDSIKVTQGFGKNRNTIFTNGTQLYLGLPPIGMVLILEGVGLDNYGIFHEPLSVLVDFCDKGLAPCGSILSNHAIADNNEIKIFPNPTKGIFQISTKEEELKTIRIYDLMGKFRSEFLKTNIIDVSNLEGGIYILELNMVNGERIIKKILKEN